MAKVGAKDMRDGKAREGDDTFLVTGTTAMKPSEDCPLGLRRPHEWISTGAASSNEGGGGGENQRKGLEITTTEQ